VALPHLFDAAVEALNPLPGSALEMHERDTIGLGLLPRGHAVLDLQGCAQRVKRVFTSSRTLAQAEEAVGEFLAVVHCPTVVCLRTMRGGQNDADAQGASAFEIPQEPACIGGSLGREYTDQHPARRPADRHEKIVVAALVGHSLPGR
jgi:hypothetical protein